MKTLDTDTTAISMAQQSYYVIRTTSGPVFRHPEYGICVLSSPFYTTYRRKELHVHTTAPR